MRGIILPAATLWLMSCASVAAGQGKATNQPPIKVPPLTTTELEDGTGTIGLPTGWRIDGSYRGTVSCKGPGGAAVVMGMPWVIQRPDHPVTNMPEAPKGPRAPVGDLAGALREVLAHNQGRLTRLRSKPASSNLPGAVHFLYEFERAGKTIVGMGFFSCIGDPNDTTLPYWQLYSSAVLAPRERFMKDLPTMMAIWNSWRPNGKKPREGSNGAMIDAVNEANRKMRTQSLKDQQEAFDRMAARWKAEVLQ
ncbi:MAG: hypothetical protein SFU56_16260 [Capsulimonadales bacterium]|nr:hypothetical protein [Capsulimonadales bacterium]